VAVTGGCVGVSVGVASRPGVRVGVGVGEGVALGMSVGMMTAAVAPQPLMITARAQSSEKASAACLRRDSRTLMTSLCIVLRGSAVSALRNRFWHSSIAPHGRGLYWDRNLIPRPLRRGEKRAVEKGSKPDVLRFGAPPPKHVFPVWRGGQGVRFQRSPEVNAL